MRRGLQVRLLATVMALAAVVVVDTEHVEEKFDADSDLVVEEETIESIQEAADAREVDPRLTHTVMENIISKLSPKCHKQVKDNLDDPSQMSERCREEISRRIQRYLKRLDEKEKTNTEGKKTGRHHKNKKRRSRKKKKLTKSQREAQKKEEEYKQTLQTILGFVATLAAVITGAMFYINRKLKAAGMYYPNPEAKATCCD
ncbi:uncharacterized protein PHALS_05151 [Plasmopara halstedii]|uniref:RxLR-like protein n=1 Tax=Plasmopara halstedii TaxID=4781 RepID=A0A0P1B0X7_PLAHL|nr:uncharacterized protein PHALS_05151 [Plasmopara halstedii]CEG47817.1 hypothetical protein PHALS_05151 [Plasmopara halstedii]|eukprot:XP_024584186.1 hypothetical protein PHALS_05151 [Plasmopara halstedii]